MDRLKKPILALVLVLQGAVFVLASTSTYTYSFHYGFISFQLSHAWEVLENDSLVILRDPALDQELWLMFAPKNNSKTPKEHALAIASAFQILNPTFLVGEWLSALGGKGVLFEIEYAEGNASYRGIGLLYLDSTLDRSLWLHFLTPEKTFQLNEAVVFLQSFLSSLTIKTVQNNSVLRALVMDKLNYKPAQVALCARALVELFDFALDLSLSRDQKEALEADVISSWSSLSAAELALYSEYPKYLETIKRSKNPDELDALKRVLRSCFETKFRRWLLQFQDEAVR
ncbi:MAG: hypothetical protein QM371_06650 [Bacillota bacterium]|nr:hypothetical protein [Bacillota bacterium]